MITIASLSAIENFWRQQTKNPAAPSYSDGDSRERFMKNRAEWRMQETKSEKMIKHAEMFCNHTAPSQQTNLPVNETNSQQTNLPANETNDNNRNLMRRDLYH